MGTYIKIKEYMPVYTGLYFEAGLIQFLVLNSFFYENNFVLEICVFDHKDKKSTFSKVLKFKDENQFHSIGRNSINSIVQKSDFLSGTHVKFFIHNKQICIEDFGSTNGTWLRISRKGGPNIPYLLTSNTIFRIGECFSFITKFPLDFKNKCSSGFLCKICNKNECDIIIYPCRHTVICQNCYENYGLRICPSCENKINSVDKIFIS